MSKNVKVGDAKTSSAVASTVPAQATKRAKRSPMLAPSTQRKIGLYKDKNPRVSYEQVSRLFNCSYQQAVYSALQYKKGHLGVRRVRVKNVEQIRDSKDPIEILRAQIHLALAQLESDKKIPVAERMSLVVQAVGVFKTMQAIEITGHLKRSDAALVIRIIRRFKPDATDEDCIKIYREEYELWKNSQA